MEVVDYEAKIRTFLESIGIPVKNKKLDCHCFLPGLIIEKGTIYCDPDKAYYPGDILHEAGHIAVTSPEIRETIGTPQMPPEWPSDGDEITAMLWSFAAANHIGIPLEVVFHPDGYKGDSDWIIEQLTNGIYIGLPLLEWFGLCHSEKNATETSPAFPHMLQWTR